MNKTVEKASTFLLGHCHLVFKFFRRFYNALCTLG